MPCHLLRRQAATAAKLRGHERPFVANRAKQTDAAHVGKRTQESRKRGIRRLRAVHVAAAATFRAEVRDECRNKPPKRSVSGIATGPKRDEAAGTDGLDQSALVGQNPKVDTRRGGIQPCHVSKVGGGQSVPFR